MAKVSNSDYVLLGEEKDTAKASWFKRSFSRMEPGSVRGSVITLSSGAIGAGLLSLPLAINGCGVVLGILMMIMAGVTFAFIYRVMVRAMDDSGEYDFPSVLNHYFGNSLRRIAECSILVTLFGALCAYQILIVQFSSDFLVSMGALLNDTWFYVFNAIVTGLICVLSIPKAFSSLRYIASGCILSLAYIVGVVLLQAPSYISTKDIGAHIEYVKFEVGTVHAFTILIFSCCSIVAMFSIYKELARASHDRACKVIDRSLGLIVVLYAVLGLAGYLSYIDNIPDLVIDREKGSGVTDWPMIIGKGGFSISLLANFLLNLHLLRTNTAVCLVGSKASISNTFFYCLNFTLIIAVGLFATFFPRVVSYFTFLGGFNVVITAVILPTLVYWKVESNPIKRGLLTAWSLIVSLVGFTSATLTILGITN